MTNFILVPEALVVAGAVVLLLVARARRRSRRWLPTAAVALALIALIVELWVGGTLATFFGGALVQDRFALFAKAAVLLSAALAIAVTDWTDEDAPAIGMAMILLAAFGVMVIASASDFVGLWAGLELAAAAGVVLVSMRRTDLGLRLVVVGGVASALVLMGLAFVYATAGSADLPTLHRTVGVAGPILPFAIPIFLLLGGLAMRAGVPPFQFARVPVALGASPLGAGLIIGLVAAGGYAMALALDPGWVGVGVTAGAAALLLASRVNPLWLLGAGAVLGGFGLV